MTRKILTVGIAFVSLLARGYDVGDYVQDGLVAQYDGIRNVGATLPHNAAAQYWVNLASPSNSLGFVGSNVASGSWTNTRILLNGNEIYSRNLSLAASYADCYNAGGYFVISGDPDNQDNEMYWADVKVYDGIVDP